MTPAWARYALPPGISSRTSWWAAKLTAPAPSRSPTGPVAERLAAACVVVFRGIYELTLVLNEDHALGRVPGLGRPPARPGFDVACMEVRVVQYILGEPAAPPSLGYAADPLAAFDAVRLGGA